MTKTEPDSPQLPEQPRLSVPLSPGETTAVATAIADLARAGLPLPSGLRAAAAELPSHRSADVLRHVASRLEAGQSLDAALSEQKSRLNRHVGGLLMAGLRTGDLGAVLEQWIVIEQQNLALRRQIFLVLAYPALLLLALIGLVLFFCEFVARGMAEVAADFEADLPATSEFLFWLSTTGRSTLWIVAAVLVVGPVLLWLLRRVPIVHGVLCSMPLLGPVWWWSGVSECCGLLGLLTGRRAPLPEALDATADAINSAYVADGCRRLAEDVTAGRDFAAAIDRLPQFPPSLAFQLTWGHRHSALPETCEAAAEMFADRAAAQLNLVRIVVPPLVFLIVIGTFVSLISATVLPMISLISKLSG
jgi:type II secretory pathway component PulF